MDGLVPLFVLFPEVAEEETRVLIMAPGMSGDMPPGRYAYSESYCVDPSCDCRRVMFQVFHTETPTSKPRHLATLNHAFEAKNADPDLGQTFLDPLNPQSRWSDRLLQDLTTLVLPSPGYAARLERHYHLVKSALKDPRHVVHERMKAIGRPAPAPTAARRDSVGRNEPCPCGSGKKYKKCHGAGGRGAPAP